MRRLDSPETPKHAGQNGAQSHAHLPLRSNEAGPAHGLQVLRDIGDRHAKLFGQEVHTAGTALSILLVRDTRGHVKLELGQSAAGERVSFREVFALTSFKDKNLFAASQAGLVSNLNDGMSWGIFPLFFTSFGLGIEKIGILKAVYPAV